MSRSVGTNLFQSTRPSRASTARDVAFKLFTVNISIHKALAGLDITPTNTASSPEYFNPQGPRGPRPLTDAVDYLPVDFNPQGPRGPRRKVLPPFNCIINISIHKALAGLDSMRTTYTGFVGNFNPQGPRGPRRATVSDYQSCNLISIHKALAGLDHNLSECHAVPDISIHKALAGLDPVPGQAPSSV